MTKSNLIFLAIGLVFVGAVIYQSLNREKKKDSNSTCGCANRDRGGRGGAETVEHDN